jgi:hypothetical protein
MTIRAHFNGTVLVPDEPLHLPVDTALELEVKRTNGFSPEVAAAMEASQDPRDTAQRLTAFRDFLERIRPRSKGNSIPAEALRREHMYGDEGR